MRFFVTLSLIPIVCIWLIIEGANVFTAILTTFGSLLYIGFFALVIGGIYLAATDGASTVAQAPPPPTPFPKPQPAPKAASKPAPEKSTEPEPEHHHDPVAVQALRKLGFSDTRARNMIDAVQGQQEMSTEQVVKAALQNR